MSDEYERLQITARRMDQLRHAEEKRDRLYEAANADRAARQRTARSSSDIDAVIHDYVQRTKRIDDDFKAEERAADREWKQLNDALDRRR